MQHIAPLLQTILWVALIAGVVIRFHRPLYGLLMALQRRIEAGGTIKAGPFELGEQVTPLGAADQRNKLSHEIERLIEAPKPNGAPVPLMERARLRSEVFQAEDLAMRAVQAEYNSPIARQVSIGADLAVDGFFMLDLRPHVVEVKYVLHPGSAADMARDELSTLSERLQRTNWTRKGLKIVLALVIQGGLEAEVSPTDFAAIASSFPWDIEVRMYPLSELQRRFGASSQEGG